MNKEIRVSNLENKLNSMVKEIFIDYYNEALDRSNFTEREKQILRNNFITFLNEKYETI